MTARLPHGDEAILDIRKIENYCLSPSHPRGRHKARVFRETLDLQHGDAAWLRDVLLDAARSGEAFQVAADALGEPLAPRRDHQATKQACCGKNPLDRANRRALAEVRHVLGVVMKTKKGTKNERPSVLDVVALLTDIPAQQLARGQVGTIVEQLDGKTLLVEFSDDQGRAYAVAPCPRADLLVLHYVPEAA
jgi:Domain of unknown function (DUF4926)/Domain of unknown function (DUF6883)